MKHMQSMTKAERDHFFRLGIRTRITELEEELTKLRQFSSKTPDKVLLSTAARTLAQRPRKHRTAAQREAMSQRMRQYWAGRHKPEKKKPGRQMTEEQRQAVSQRMKQVWAERTPAARMRHAKLMQAARKLG